MAFDHDHAGAGNLSHRQQVEPIVHQVADHAMAQRAGRCRRRQAPSLYYGLDGPRPRILVPSLPAAAGEQGAWGDLSLAASVKKAAMTSGSLIRRSLPALSCPIFSTFTVTPSLFFYRNRDSDV